MKNLYEDLANVGELASVGIALAQFAESLAKGTPIEGRFELKGQYWLYYDPFGRGNFVGFRVYWRRSKKIGLSLWGGGALHSVESRDLLRLWAGRRATYRSCDITRARQLAAAALYIEKAFELYRDSRNCPKERA